MKGISAGLGFERNGRALRKPNLFQFSIREPSLGYALEQWGESPILGFTATDHPGHVDIEIREQPKGVGKMGGIKHPGGPDKEHYLQCRWKMSPTERRLLKHVPKSVEKRERSDVMDFLSFKDGVLRLRFHKPEAVALAKGAGRKTARQKAEEARRRDLAVLPKAEPVPEPEPEPTRVNVDDGERIIVAVYDRPTAHNHRYKIKDELYSGLLYRPKGNGEAPKRLSLLVAEEA